MCRVCGQIERLTDRPAICRPARIHFNEGNLRRHMKSQQLRVEVSLNVVLMMKRKLIESLSPHSGIQSSMRSSKSMPESNIRKFNKWGSINTDSGISLYSSDTMKHKDAMSISSSSSSSITKPPIRPQQMLPPDGLAHKLSAQQMEDVRR